jgi:predicted ATP-grasp superfamily ATP-dependent carboligase
VAYAANFENHPTAVARLAAGRELWGNPPAVLRRVRNPIELARALQSHGHPTARVSLDKVSPETADSRTWLVKPISSGGGRAIREWNGDADVGRRTYLQEFVEGTPHSAVFVAGRDGVVLLGISRQLVGDPAFGANGFQYCGNVLMPRHAVTAGREHLLRVTSLLSTIVNEFGLVGVNGIDYVEQEGVPIVVEVNPRWTASVELVERMHDVSAFHMHAVACRDGGVPAFDIRQANASPAAVGKAVIYARRNLITGDTGPWLDDADIRDVPRPGESIAAGQPVCTIFAEGLDSSSCYAELTRRAAQLYASLDAFSA